MSERLLPLSSKSRGGATARNGKKVWKCFRLSGVKAGADSIDDVKSAVFTFADNNPAGTLLPLVCVFKIFLLSVSSSRDCLRIKVLENWPREVSLFLNHTDYITAPSVQALLAFENFSVLINLARD